MVDKNASELSKVIFQDSKNKFESVKPERKD